jgi:hypothetical protein
MKRKFVIATGLLAVSAALIFVSAPNAKACAGGGGDQQYIETVCVDVETGEIVRRSNDCDSGSANCNDNDCS